MIKISTTGKDAVEALMVDRTTRAKNWLAQSIGSMQRLLALAEKGITDDNAMSYMMRSGTLAGACEDVHVMLSKIWPVAVDCAITARTKKQLEADDTRTIQQQH